MKGIQIKISDITKKEEVDAIVNAANTSLLGGGGVDGAIHRAARPKLLTESAKLGDCLPAKFVIHAMGSIWRGGDHDDEKVLAAAYQNSLEQALKIEARSVTFPAISTGVYRFPPERTAEIAVRTASQFLREHGEIGEVRLVCFSRESEAFRAEALRKLTKLDE